MPRPWRSGFCGHDAVPWQHARCLGAHDGIPCCCDCHSGPGTLAEFVARRDLAALVADVDQLTAGPGVLSPALVRLRAATVELLAEVTADA